MTPVNASYPKRQRGDPGCMPDVPTAVSPGFCIPAKELPGFRQRTRGEFLEYQLQLLIGHRGLGDPNLPFPSGSYLDLKRLAASC
jgi:hypothetical protein